MSHFKPLTDYLLSSALSHNSIFSTDSGHEFDFDVDGDQADAHLFLEYNPTNRLNNRLPSYQLAFVVVVRIDQEDPKDSQTVITINSVDYGMNEREILDLTETIYEDYLQMLISEDNGISVEAFNAISLIGHGDSVYSGWRVEVTLTLHRGVDRCPVPAEFGALPSSGI